MVSDHEDEDDDLYSTSETKPAQQSNTKDEQDASSGDEPMDEGADSGDDDDDEDDDSESDLEIIIDKPPTAPRPTTQQAPPESKAIKIEAPNQSTTPSQAPPKAPGGSIVPQLSVLPGTSYPAVQSSSIDVNSNPVYPPQGKPLLQVDMDADLAEEQKIWRRPGEDQSDYFNYGFDEFTWETYRQRQLSMANTIQQQKNDMVQMQQMMGGGPMPGMPNMPPAGNAPPTGPAGGQGGGGGGGMNEQQQMEMMFQQMVSQGMDPSQMDFGSFMQMAGGGMPGFGGPGGPGGQQGAFQGGGNQGVGGRGGRGGRGRGW